MGLIALKNGSAMNRVETREDDLEVRVKPLKSLISRRSFLGTSLAVGVGTIGAGLLALPPRRALRIRVRVAVLRRETRLFCDSWRQQKSSKPISGSNTTNLAASKTTKSQAAMAIQPIPRPWRLLRMK